MWGIKPGERKGGSKNYGLVGKGGKGGGAVGLGKYVGGRMG